MTMKNTLNNIIVFAAGAAIGSVVTWKLVKTKYEQIAQEEIDSVKELYSSRQGESNGPKPVSEEESDEEDVTDDDELEEYEGLIENSGYITESNIDKIQNGREDVKKMNTDKPYVISPEEYDDSEYEKITLYYYANNVLIDSLTDGIVDKEDWEEMVGLDFMNHFGDYEEDPDTVYIANDNWLIAYEILKELDDYPEDN